MQHNKQLSTSERTRINTLEMAVLDLSIATNLAIHDRQANLKELRELMMYARNAVHVLEAFNDDGLYHFDDYRDIKIMYAGAVDRYLDIFVMALDINGDLTPLIIEKLARRLNS